MCATAAAAAAAELNNKPNAYTRRALLLYVPSALRNKSTTNNCLLLLNSTTNQLQIQQDYCYNMCPALCLKNKYMFSQIVNSILDYHGGVNTSIFVPQDELKKHKVNPEETYT